MPEENAENAEQERNTVAELQERFESLHIPSGIDPKLLELYLEREREEIEKSESLSKPKDKSRSRSLSILFAAYIGIVVMCFSIILGFLQEKEPAEILANTCRNFLIYSAAGFIFGWVAEYCVSESVETLLREIIRRSSEEPTT
jgi:hypothetical protein